MSDREYFREGVPDLGPCCCCGKAEGARNLVMLRRKAPVPGTGWGCVVCHLPADGASYLACDACLGAGAEPREVIWGFPIKRERLPVEELSDEVFEHDMRYHEDES